MIPLYGFLEGDTIGLVVLADADETVAALAGKLRAAARLRTAIEGPITVLYEGKPIDLQSTVSEIRMRPLGRFDVRRGPTP